MDASHILTAFKVVPVVVVDDAEQACRLAEILMAHGLNCIEVTLRTPGALDAINALHKQFPGLTLGAGSVTSLEQLKAVEDMGAQFAVSPGSTEELLASNFPIVPGGVTATEVMQLRSKSYTTIKFFPAELSGGLKYINALSEPIPDVHFFPTGGINADNYESYLAHERITCVGGSWLAPITDVRAGAWGKIEQRCAALGL